jgi:hypothetical protein
VFDTRSSLAAPPKARNYQSRQHYATGMPKWQSAAFSALSSTLDLQQLTGLRETAKNLQIRASLSNHRLDHGRESERMRRSSDMYRCSRSARHKTSSAPFHVRVLRPR